MAAVKILLLQPDSHRQNCLGRKLPSLHPLARGDLSLLVHDMGIGDSSTLCRYRESEKDEERREKHLGQQNLVTLGKEWERKGNEGNRFENIDNAFCLYT
jgi:hypothetical protein